MALSIEQLRYGLNYTSGELVHRMTVSSLLDIKVSKYDYLRAMYNLMVTDFFNEYETGDPFLNDTEMNSLIQTYNVLNYTNYSL